VLVAWVVAFAILLGAGGVAVLVLNATAFGAAGFVRVYLDAVARGDAAGALGMPGVTVDSGLRDDLLIDDALAGLTEVREVSTVRGDDGTEVVTFVWIAGDVESTSSFTVERIGSRLALFPEWAFVVSPVSTLRLTVENDARFDVNGVDVQSGAGAEPLDYAVLTPGVYRVDHSSTYLRARAIDAVAQAPGAVVEATLEVLATAAFREQIDLEVHEHLDECATQEVLFPTGCPLGRAIANRVASTPDWSIVEYPELTIEPGVEFGTWLVSGIDGVANLTVDVQQLFDGTIATLDDDIPFTATYLVTIGADDTTLHIEALL
jgi:hypothetical protein